MFTMYKERPKDILRKRDKYFLVAKPLRGGQNLIHSSYTFCEEGRITYIAHL